MAGFHESFALDRDVKAHISPARAFPVPDGLLAKLRDYLKQFTFVKAAYLVQFVYVGDKDQRLGNRPCLTVGVAIKRQDAARLVSEISRNGQAAVAGQLGEWGFLDWYSVATVGESTFKKCGPPFYVRKSWWRAA